MSPNLDAWRKPCNYCGEVGHSQPNCPDWVRDEVLRMSSRAKESKTQAPPVAAVTGRKASELNEAERTHVLDAVRGLLIAERETGIAQEELVRIIASHRQSRARLDRREDEWLAARVSRQSVPGRMTFTVLEKKG